MKFISNLFTSNITRLFFLTIVATAVVFSLEVTTDAQRQSQQESERTCLKEGTAVDEQLEVVTCVDETGGVYVRQVPAETSTVDLAAKSIEEIQGNWIQAQAQGTTQALPGGNLWQCYEDGGPSCYNTLNDVQFINESEGWAVGDGGTILHYKNGSWEKVPTPTRRGKFYSISMLSATDGWVAGYDFDLQEALTLHWDGSTWQKVSNPATSTIQSISMISSDNGWAVGLGGYDFDRKVWYSSFLHWDGIEWQIAATPDGIVPRDVEMISATDGWIVGGNDGQTLIFRWDGSTWQSVTSPTTETLYSVSMVSTSDGWAVGSNGVIIRWNGSSWQSVTSPASRALTTISMVSDADGWAMGLFNLIRWNGTTWQNVSTPASFNPRSVWMVSDTNGWMVGYPGTIHHWNGGLWKGEITPPAYTLRTVSMVSATDGWIGGWSSTHGGGLFLRWNGTTWETVSSPTTGTPQAIDMLSATNGWAVSWDPQSGTSQILQWNGASWQIVTNPTPTKKLVAISMLSTNDGWIAGEDGVALYWNGSSWQIKSTGLPADYKMDAIRMVSSNDVWAVGYIIDPNFNAIPTIYRWNGTTWSNLGIEFENKLQGIDVVSPTEVWFVGDFSNIYHWDGSQLKSVSNPTERVLASIDMLSTNEGWAVGDFDGLGYSGSAISHWNGSYWREFKAPTDIGLFSISVISPTDGWAVGDAAILRFQPISTASIPPTGGDFTSPSGDTTFTFPSGAFQSTTSVTFTARLSLPYNASRINIGHNFEISGLTDGSNQPAQPAQPYMIVFNYDDTDIKFVIEDTLAFYFWNGSEWEKEPTSNIDTTSNTITATPSQFYEWTVLGERRAVFLPVLLKE